VQAQDCLIHHSCEEKDLLDLLAFRDSPQLVPESNRELGFEKPFLLFGFDWRCWGGMVILTPIVSKPVKDVKYCYIDFVMGFVTPLYAQLPRISGVLRNVPKRFVCVTRRGVSVGLPESQRSALGTTARSSSLIKARLTLWFRLVLTLDAKQAGAERWLNALPADSGRVKRLCGWDWILPESE
jgi:hypothetical protein